LLDVGLGKRWTPGEKLKLLFAGYNGTRNTGSDVRVQEMLRQIRHVLGAGQVDFSVMTQSFDRTKATSKVLGRSIFPMLPAVLFREVRQNHGVIACEGSMFKSKFANALTTMIGSLGLASAENKLSLAYAGAATWIESSSPCANATFTIDGDQRNVESQPFEFAGIPTELGTDTAWTFEHIRPNTPTKFCASPAG